MMETVNVLVLGVGGNVSQGILKALAASSLHLRVVGACVEPQAFGLYTVDRSYISPYAKDPGFMDWLMDVCKEENIKVILSGVEQILEVLAANQQMILKQCGAVCIVSESRLLEIANDKEKTCQWLKSNHLNYADFASADDEDAIKRLISEVGFPLIAKPKRGKGSAGLVLIHSEKDLALVRGNSDYLIQEYLGTEKEEYTVGCFCNRQHEIKGIIVMKRDLVYGTTYRAMISNQPLIEEEARKIVEKLKPLGPCNIQMRLDGDRAVCFEINLRFSGTTPMRARFGFNDVEAAIKYFGLHEEIENLQPAESGIALRYWNEIYVPISAYEKLKEEGKLDQPQDYGCFIEDYGLENE